MSERITPKHLGALLARMSDALNAPKGKLWSRDDKGNNVALVGALLLESGSQLYGRAWKVCQLVNDAGGERVLLSAPTSRELYYRMHAWLEGYQARAGG